MESNLPVRYNPKSLGRFSNASEIYFVDFPIYYIECFSERHFIVAGGGGSSKTGVLNQINILELVPEGNSCAAELVMKFQTPDELPDAIMTGSLMRHLPLVDSRFVTGGCYPTIYHIDFNHRNKSFSITDYDVFGQNQEKREMKSLKCIPGKVLTGGTDGQLMIWKLDSDNTNPKLERQIKAHSKEIDEIDVDLVKQQIVTLSRSEIRCAVWNLSNLKLVQEFKKESINTPQPTGFKYCYRSCKYAQDSSASTFLFIVCNPVPSKGSSKLFRWPTKDFKEPKSISLAYDGIMAMTTSLDGKYLALGTRCGSVNVFDVKSLKPIYKVDSAHYNAITKLEFLAPKPDSLTLTNCKTCPLISVSIDRRIVLHRPKKSSLTLSICMMLILAMIILILKLLTGF